MPYLRLAPAMRTPPHTIRKVKDEFQSSGKSKEAVRFANRLTPDGSHLPEQMGCRTEQLAGNVEVVDPVPLPALIVIIGAERFLLAIADGLDSVRRHTFLQQRPLHRLRTARSQREVIFLRSAIVAVSFDDHLDRRMLCQKLRIAVRGRCLITPDVR